MEYQKRNRCYLFIGKPLAELPTDRVPTNSEVLANFFWNRDVLNHDPNSAIDATFYSLINTCQLLDIAHPELKNLKRKFLSKEGLLHQYNNAKKSSTKPKQPESALKLVSSLTEEYDCRSKISQTITRKLLERKRLDERRSKSCSSPQEVELDQEVELEEDSLTVSEACSIAEELADPSFEPRIKSEFKQQIQIIQPELIDCLDRVRLSGAICNFVLNKFTKNWILNSDH